MVHCKRQGQGKKSTIREPEHPPESKRSTGAASRFGPQGKFFPGRSKGSRLALPHLRPSPQPPMQSCAAFGPQGNSAHEQSLASYFPAKGGAKVGPTQAGERMEAPQRAGPCLVPDQKKFKK